MAAVILIAVVALVVWGGSVLWGAVSPAADDTPPGSPTPAASSTPSTTPTPQQPQDCRAADLDVEISLASTDVTIGEGTGIQVRLRNDGAPCLFEAGPPQLVATITSGDDTVWRSDHCGSDATRLLLDTGVEHDTTMRWAGRRSVAGCPGDQPVAGAGTYRLIVEVAGEPVGQVGGLVFVVG